MNVDRLQIITILEVPAKAAELWLEANTIYKKKSFTKEYYKRVLLESSNRTVFNHSGLQLGVKTPERISHPQPQTWSKRMLSTKIVRLETGCENPQRDFSPPIANPSKIICYHFLPSLVPLYSSCTVFYINDQSQISLN